MWNISCLGLLLWCWVLILRKHWNHKKTEKMGPIYFMKWWLIAFILGFTLQISKRVLTLMAVSPGSLLRSLDLRLLALRCRWQICNQRDDFSVLITLHSSSYGRFEICISNLITFCLQDKLQVSNCYLICSNRNATIYDKSTDMRIPGMKRWRTD